MLTAEAPRGTLIHRYNVDDEGLVRWAGPIIATGHNNLAMKRGALQVARRFVDANNLQEGITAASALPCTVRAGYARGSADG